MRFQKEVWERYSDCQNRAKRIVRKGEANDAELTLPVLDDILDKTKVAGEVDMGVLDIPVNQIVGIASESDNDIYTSDFLPIPSVQSEYAEKWTQLYIAHLSNVGLTDPITCYEYLGKFYVVDGKKRVSILKDNGTMMVKAKVIRILPVETDEPQIQNYYKFIKTFEKTGLYQIVFTQADMADQFLKALGYDPEHVWDESDRYSFMFHWYPFERALKLAFDDNLQITTADAMMVLLEKYSYEELRQLPSWTLAELMQESWMEMYQISNPDFKINARIA